MMRVSFILSHFSDCKSFLVGYLRTAARPSWVACVTEQGNIELTGQTFSNTVITEDYDLIRNLSRVQLMLFHRYSILSNFFVSLNFPSIKKNQRKIFANKKIQKKSCELVTFLSLLLHCYFRKLGNRTFVWFYFWKIKAAIVQNFIDSGNLKDHWQPSPKILYLNLIKNRAKIYSNQRHVDVPDNNNIIVIQ